MGFRVARGKIPLDAAVKTAPVDIVENIVEDVVDLEQLVQEEQVEDLEQTLPLQQEEQTTTVQNALKVIENKKTKSTAPKTKKKK